MTDIVTVVGGFDVINVVVVVAVNISAVLFYIVAVNCAVNVVAVVVAATFVAFTFDVATAVGTFVVAAAAFVVVAAAFVVAVVFMTSPLFLLIKSQPEQIRRKKKILFWNIFQNLQKSGTRRDEIGG